MIVPQGLAIGPRNRRKATVKKKKNRPLRRVATKGTIPKVSTILNLCFIVVAFRFGQAFGHNASINVKKSTKGHFMIDSQFSLILTHSIKD